MINYDSILSAFDGKPTLLQWLKMVKKALDESILKNINITQNGQKVVFTFNFEDGTSISTPEVTLPKGDKGDTGATGPKGDNGVSITGIDSVGNEVVGDETLTTLRAHYSNDTTDDFVVRAKNGKDATVTGGNIYTHLACIRNSASSYHIYLKVYSSKENLTLEDVLAQIPTAHGNPGSIFDKPKIPVCFNWVDKYGVLSATKYGTEGNYTIEVGGVISDGNSVNSQTATINNPILESDILLG